ncbi:prepilin-type N-terminal cleavage/methylation domain-containing protein [bacterium]|nr:prepilin-type N-terminal cleavage/methylation domain-containing protein [bacterium]
MIIRKNDLVLTTPPYSRKTLEGFTLAEVLITLVIIGVIAAITVPTLIIKHQKEETVTRLKKVYSTLSQTTYKAVAEYGDIKTWEMMDGVTGEASQYFTKKYMLPYLSIAKDCGLQTTNECKFEYNNLNGSTGRNIDNSYHRFYLSDGTLVAVNARQNLSSSGHKKMANIFVDINGQKKPNKQGRDIFGFNYMIDCIFPQLNGKLVPRYFDQNRASLVSNSDSMCHKNQQGDGCLALIMLDSWQIKDDYPW